MGWGRNGVCLTWRRVGGEGREGGRWRWRGGEKEGRGE